MLNKKQFLKIMNLYETRLTYPFKKNYAIGGQRIVLKNCQHGGGKFQKYEKITDIVYGWSLVQKRSDTVIT